MVKVSDIANFLKKKYVGKNIQIKKPASLDNIVKNSNKNNVSSILSINTKISEFDELYKLIKNYNSIWCSVGEHPFNIRKDFIPSKDLILSKINKKVIGIGETGIDLYYSKNNIERYLLLASQLYRIFLFQNDSI